MLTCLPACLCPSIVFNLCCPDLPPQVGGIGAAVVGDELQANEAAFAGDVALNPPSLLPHPATLTYTRKYQPLRPWHQSVVIPAPSGALRVSVG